MLKNCIFAQIISKLTFFGSILDLDQPPQAPKGSFLGNLDMIPTIFIDSSDKTSFGYKRNPILAKKSIFRVKKSVFGLFLKKITNIFLSYQFAWTTNIAKNLPEVKNQKTINTLAV